MGNLNLCLCFYVKHEDYILIYENYQRNDKNINKEPIYACSCNQSSKVPSDSFFKSIVKQKRKESLNIKDFNILKMIGRGGFGRVLLVERKLNGTIIKFGYKKKREKSRSHFIFFEIQTSFYYFVVLL